MWSELWHGESWDLLSGKYTFADDGHLGRNAFVKMDTVEFSSTN